jgi:hypothetical protein
VLIVKGRRVAFDFVDGAEMDVSPEHAMMHDPEGKTWARCSVLIGPFSPGSPEGVPKGGKSVSAARDYYGRSYELKAGELDTPPRALSGWRKVGLVRRIYYWRPGPKYRGDFQHPVGKRKHVFFGPKGRGAVYVRGRWVRLELPAGCILDDRGFVWP